MRIAVVAPSNALKPETAEEVSSIVRDRGDCDLIFHPQCFLSQGHFAGSDAERLAALRETMADPAVDAVWFARGGYGSNRIAQAAISDLPQAARSKTYMGYSDTGFLLAALHKAGLEVAHGPMPQDVLRDGGDSAIDRALDWLVRRDPSARGAKAQAAGDGFQPDRIVEPAGDGAGAGLRRGGADPRGSRRASLPDRPVDVPHRLQPIHSASRPDPSRTGVGHPGQRSSLPPRRGGNRRALVRAKRASKWARSADIGHDSGNKDRAVRPRRS
jgi:hypothetical protein